MLPRVRHLHVSDAAGRSGEGLQIGDGAIDFAELLPLLWKTDAGMVPEIWLGHHAQGEGFYTALHRLTEIAWAVRATRPERPMPGGTSLAAMVVSEGVTIRDALARIEANKTGIVFVLDAEERVIAVTADGDIRRALLNGETLAGSIRACIFTDYVSARRDEPRALARSRVTPSIRVIPVLDAAQRLVDCLSIFDDV